MELRRSARIAIVGAFLSTVLTGCESFLVSFAAGSTTRVQGRSMPVITQMMDPETAEAALPNVISTLEGLMLANPNSEVLALGASRGYCLFAFGFMEDHAEQLLNAGDATGSNYYLQRAESAYLRGREIGLDQLTVFIPDDGGSEAALKRGLKDWRAYVQGFDNPEHAPMLLWTAFAWTRLIAMGRVADPVAEREQVTALLEQAHKLNAQYHNYESSITYAMLVAAASAEGTDDLNRVDRALQEALTGTHGESLMANALFARHVLVNRKDRKGFEETLNAVIRTAQWSSRDLNLENQLARRRAQRWLDMADRLFAAAGSKTTSTSPAGGVQ